MEQPEEVTKHIPLQQIITKVYMQLKQPKPHGNFLMVAECFEISDLFCDFASSDDQILVSGQPSIDLWIPRQLTDYF